MGTIRFYHLKRGALDATVRTLSEKALAGGLRVEVRVPSPARADWLDARLWLGPEDGFLPHGRAGGLFDDRQPVLVTVDAAEPASPAPPDRCLMCLDGVTPDPAEAATLDRVFLLFEDSDGAAVAGARSQWKTLQGIAGAALEYWSDGSGSWAREA